jgi:hypothetical protein
MDWMAIGKGKDSREALTQLANQEPIVSSTNAVDLQELVELLRGTIGDPAGTWASRVFQAMLRAQSVHPLIPRAILQALLPGLIAVARRLSWGSGGDWTDGGAFFSDLIAMTWEVITAWSGQDRPYALLDLLSAIRCRMRRQILNPQAGRELALGPDIDRVLQTKGSLELSDLELLARTIQDLAGNELDATDAAILYGHRVLGLSMTELSKLTGRSRRFLSDRRRRAEELFCA